MDARRRLRPGDRRRRADLRLHQRLPRQRQLDRHRGLHPGALARAWRWSGPRSSTSSRRSWSGPRWPRPIGKGLIDAVGGGSQRHPRRAARRDRLGPDHLVSGPAQLVLARADRRLRRRGHRQGRASAPCILARLDAADPRSSCSRRSSGWRSRSGSPWDCPGCCESAPPGPAGPGLPTAAAALGGALLAESRRQRRAEDDGHHRRPAGLHSGAVRRRARAGCGYFYVPTADRIPLWVEIAAYTAIGLGTALGGWRIVKTMGSRITKLRPFGGFCAETAGGISDPDRLAAGRAGEHHAHHHRRDRRRRARRSGCRRCAGAWRRRIVWAWILTIPMSAAIAAVAYLCCSKRV